MPSKISTESILTTFPNARLDAEGLIYFVCKEDPMKFVSGLDNWTSHVFLYDSQIEAISARLMREFSIMEQEDGTFKVRPKVIKNWDEILKDLPDFPAGTIPKKMIDAEENEENRNSKDFWLHKLKTDQSDIFIKMRLLIQARLFPILKAELAEHADEYYYSTSKSKADSIMKAGFCLGAMQQSHFLLMPGISVFGEEPGLIKIKLDPHCKLIKYGPDVAEEVVAILGRELEFTRARNQAEQAKGKLNLTNPEYLRRLFDIMGLQGYVNEQEKSVITTSGESITSKERVPVQVVVRVVQPVSTPSPAAPAPVAPAPAPASAAPQTFSATEPSSARRGPPPQTFSASTPAQTPQAPNPYAFTPEWTPLLASSVFAAPAPVAAAAPAVAATTPAATAAKPSGGRSRAGLKPAS